VSELKKCVRTSELFSCDLPLLKDLFENAEYPWQLLPKIGPFLKELTDTGLSGFCCIGEHIWVGEGVKIAPTATIEGRVILCDGCEVRPGAYIRGNVFTGPNCVIGNSSELKNCILLRHVQVPHYNYVGDSVLGNFSHMGAGSICSNLRSDGKNVTVHGEEDYPTGLRKVGAFIADRGDIGCGCVLNPGSVIGQGTSVYPLTSVRGVMPAGAIVKSMKEIVKREER